MPAQLYQAETKIEISVAGAPARAITIRMTFTQEKDGRGRIHLIDTRTEYSTGHGIWHEGSMIWDLVSQAQMDALDLLFLSECKPVEES